MDEDRLATFLHLSSLKPVKKTLLSSKSSSRINMDAISLRKRRPKLFSTSSRIDGKRQAELKKLFAGSSAGLVFVTTFLDRETMREYLPEISWETEVWVADAPDYLIYFNGERFLGPFE